MDITKEIKKLNKCIEFIEFKDSKLIIYNEIFTLLYNNSFFNIFDNCKHRYNKKHECVICGIHKNTHFTFYYDKIVVINTMKMLMKCMNYVIKKAEKTELYHESEIYYDIYNILGHHAWSDIANHCKHEYKINKKYPSGRCEYCGTIKNGDINEK